MSMHYMHEAWAPDQNLCLMHTAEALTIASEEQHNNTKVLPILHLKLVRLTQRNSKAYLDRHCNAMPAQLCMTCCSLGGAAVVVSSLQQLSV